MTAPYAPKPGDRAILRVTVAPAFGATIKIETKHGDRFNVWASDLEPDLTPEPPKPLEAGDWVKLKTAPSPAGCVLWTDGDEALVRWSGVNSPQVWDVIKLERVPQ